jgi:anti-anti-sigma regulatory factor
MSRDVFNAGARTQRLTPSAEGAKPLRVLRWQLDQVGGRLTVALVGVLDENADLRPLAQLDGDVAIDLSGVKRISSTGVREWIDLMRALAGRCRVALVACSPASVTQLNLIANFRGAAQVESFIAPYECLRCGEEREVLIEARTCGRKELTLPAMPCSSCGALMELAEIPERYLTFLADQRSGRWQALA